MGVATTYKAPVGYCCEPDAAAAACSNKEVVKVVTRQVTTKQVGDGGEDRAWAHLQRQGLTLVQRNYRVAAGPNARGAEVDLICRDRDGTLVFVEVKARKTSGFGGAAASVTPSKQRSLILAARHYLRQFPTPPACRFDVVAIEGEKIAWLKAAFNEF
ncbi:MAG: YraN family protein [Pseudorhodobacter sp.]|nr:YraN family protein [Rhizobacter sp.]